MSAANEQQYLLPVDVPDADNPDLRAIFQRFFSKQAANFEQALKMEHLRRGMLSIQLNRMRRLAGKRK